MKARIKLITVVITIYCTSCQTSEKYLINKIGKCIDSNVSIKRDKIGYLETQDVNQTFRNFEGYLLKKGHLDNPTKESYSNLIDKILKYPENYLDIYKHVNNSDIYIDSDIIVNPSLILLQCPYYVIVTEKNEFNSTVVQQYDIVNSIVDSNYEDEFLIRKLFNSTSEEKFSRLMFRVPFMYIVLMNVEKKYAPR